MGTVTATRETAATAPLGRAPSSATGSAVLAVAAIASLGAGALHATAAGAHSEHRAAVVAFVLTAIAQLGWGAWALRRSGRVVGGLGATINSAAFGGWLLAKTSGIAFVAGLEAKEDVRFADGLAATLAVVAIAGSLAALVDGAAATARPVVLSVASVATVALVIPGMVATASHSHTGGHDHDAIALPVPYLATLPVDLGGIPGVSEAEVAEAEALVTEALQVLPRFGDVSAIGALGYHSIGDAETGFEHFINWELISDGRVLDPAHPESLVFKVDPATGTKLLSAAMFMANPGDTLDTVPDVGGALVQWHIHDNLCFAGEPNAWRVADVLEPGDDCRPGTFRLSNNALPMVHVWIIPHECGPFAALEGDGAGQLRPGEERLCDHAHGAPS